SLPLTHSCERHAEQLRGLAQRETCLGAPPAQHVPTYPLFHHYRPPFAERGGASRPRPAAGLRRLDAELRPFPDDDGVLALRAHPDERPRELCLAAELRARGLERLEQLGNVRLEVTLDHELL